MSKNGMIDGQPFDFINLFDKFETHGTSDPSVPRMRKALHIKLFEAGRTESVSTVDDDSGNFD
jgi:hypothetical protein